MESNIKHDEQQVQTTDAYRQGTKTKETRLNLISFVFMISLTGFAFFAVGAKIIPLTFALPFIVLLAVIQVFLQLAIFMHMNQEGHQFPLFFVLSAIFAVLLTIAGCGYLIWW